MPGRVRAFGQLLVDVGQRFAAVDLRLAGTQQVEVGSVQDQDLCHEAIRQRPEVPESGAVCA
jgi:hypothetical protein